MWYISFSCKKRLTRSFYAYFCHDRQVVWISFSCIDFVGKRKPVFIRPWTFRLGRKIWNFCMSPSGTIRGWKSLFPTIVPRTIRRKLQKTIKKNTEIFDISRTRQMWRPWISPWSGNGLWESLSWPWEMTITLCRT